MLEVPHVEGVLRVETSVVRDTDSLGETLVLVSETEPFCSSGTCGVTGGLCGAIVVNASSSCPLVSMAG